MLEFINTTNTTCELFHCQSKTEKAFALILQKNTYQFDRNAKLEASPAQFCLQDIYGACHQQTYLIESSDLIPYKHFPELLLQGSLPLAANEQNGKLLKLYLWYADGNHFQKSVFVQGDRCWSKRFRYKKLCFDKTETLLTLDHTRSFGGYCAGQYDENNPVGIGYLLPPQEYENQYLPNLEYPDDRLKKPYDRIMAASFAPIARHWPIRKTQTQRARYLTYQTAPSDQFLPRFKMPRFLQLSHFALFSEKSADLRIALPERRTQFLLESDTLTMKRALSFDTLHIDITRKTLTVISRASFPCPKTLSGIITVKSC